MAEAAVLAGLGWVASPIVSKLINKASTYLGVDMASELQDLETTVLPQFELMVEAAEKSPHKKKLKAWLQWLKESYYDTEDLLDEHEYNLLERRVKRGKDPSLGDGATSSKSTILKHLRAAKSKASNFLPENRRLITKIRRLKDILSKARNFRDLLGLPTTPAAPVATTTSLLPTLKVFGRDKDRGRIIDILLSNTTAASYSSLAIVGAGGMGKSTLAQYVYNDKWIEEYFDLRMWVCISRKLDVRRHTREIIESATKGKCPSIDNLDTLQCKLKEKIRESKKCLLVLDDVWFQESDSNEIEWQQLLAPLLGKAGSKVLVTSQRSTFPGALFCERIFQLHNMDDSEFLTLFKHHAFSGAKINDQMLQLKLEEIAEQIAKKLGKSPLAAQVVGAQLSREKSETKWRAALRIKNLDEPMGAFLWSYKKLDPQLQRCFSYCSLFPKGHKFKIDELVHLWVAEGFVDSCNSSKPMEDIGKDYFNEMVYGSFFQLVFTRYSGSWYIMHDLLHELAESLSREDCFRLEDDKVTKIPCTVRHLSVCVASMTKHKQIIGELRRLRTVICIDPLIDDVDDIFHQILQNLKKLRVLCLLCYNTSKLPESVGELKHLRYLNLVKTFICELPRSLGNLYQLQLLQLNHKVKSLPDEVCNLSKLRHLEGYDDKINEMLERDLPQVPNIGKLTSLQKLNEFSVQKNKGHELRQLMDMNELGGCLHIKNLENVTGKVEALESKLHMKSHLKQLRFEWSFHDDDTKYSVHVEILEGLVPPAELEGLVIIGYQSATYPWWLLDGSYLKNLKSFQLVHCNAVEGLPSDKKLFQNCNFLQFHWIPNLKTLPCLPKGLTDLSVDGCPLLKFIAIDDKEEHDPRENTMCTDQLARQLALLWEVCSSSFIKVLSEEHSFLKQSMNLMGDDISRHLQIIESVLEDKRDEIFVKEDIIKAWLCCNQERIKLICGKSIGLQGLIPPSGLRQLHLSSCIITDRAFAICLSCLNSLRDLKLMNIMTLGSLPSEEVFQHLTKLESLIIEDCWCLRSLGGLRAAPTLSMLRILYCPSLELASGSRFMPLSLRSLYIDGCLLASDIFCSDDLPNLNKLHIFSCRSSESLSVGDGRLPSLKVLSLFHLPDLRMLEGLSSLQLNGLELIDVPKLTAECISQFRVKNTLYVSSSKFLNHMVSAEGFTLPSCLSLSCKEPTVSFEESANLSSVKHLTLRHCQMKSLPTNTKCLTGLEKLDIHSCPNILSLPDLPSSLQHICISDCEPLKDSCRAPDGESWPKIAHIRWKEI